MKIIIINNLYAPWIRGGAERVVEKTVVGLEKAGHEVFVIATAPKESRTDKVFYLPSIFYYLEKYPLWRRFFWHLWDMINFINRVEIKKILQEKKPDLVITHNLQGIGLLVPGLLRKMKIKHFHTLHDIQLLHPSGLMIWGKEKIVETFPARVYQKITRWLFGSPAAIISPSQWLLDEHAKRGFFTGSTKKVLPNFFPDQRSFSQKKNETRNMEHEFLYVGQLEPHKGVEFLVETFLKFSDERNFKAGLTIVGSGSRLEEIKKIVGDNKKIKILGRKNPGEIEELMLNADCLIVPSLCYENSPTVIYEAIAAQLPVIASRIGGITELMAAAGGLLIEPGNQEELLKQLKLIFTQPTESDRIREQEAAYQPLDYITEVTALAADNTKY
ncbi:MAG TPA: glycosyltransferase family 4 protein [Candidatus Methylomirabilis sp.]|nr:glycosyltransferase family 4 protein [Candidatus Methylomirabilis sp.]